MRKDNTLLKEILEQVKDILESVEGITFKEYLNNREKRRAIERALEIIGEAAGKLSAKFRDKYNYVDWDQLKAYRNELIHQYAIVDNRTVWEILTDDIPELETVIPEILNDLE